MKINRFILIFVALISMFSFSLHAQSADEKLIEFTAEHAVMEDNPKQQNYNITIFSPDGQWKMQLNYHADGMFGTFTNDDFDLSGSGKNYNYVRNPKNDMVFYSFVDMNVTVADEGTLYRVNANCLTNNNMRFIVEATIDAPEAKETRTDDLGYARLEPNYFYGTWAIYAENDNYRLGYGVVGEELLGTFYRADILMPELYDKKAGKNVNVLTASAAHTKDGENTNFKIDILSEDLVLYSLTMFNGPYDIEITDEKTVDIHGAVLQDLTDFYGCYQFGGVNNDYGMALAVKPEVIMSGRKTWGKDDFLMQFTKLVTLSDQISIPIFDIQTQLDTEDDILTLKSEVTSMDGVLYHVTMYMDNGAAPVATDTLNIDFGAVRVLDYTKGVGTIGLGAAVQGKYQIRCYFDAYTLNGEFKNDDILLDMSDIMVVNEQSGTYVFHDAKYVTASMNIEGQRTNITIDMIGVDDVLYHATMYLDSLQCMKDMQLSIDAKDNVRMIAIQESDGEDYAEYTLQFQDMDKVYDKFDNIVGDGYVLSYYFGHNGKAAVADTYGYSTGTLAEDEYHTFFEKGCEVRIAPVAGTLSLVPTQEVKITIGSEEVTSYMYNVESQFVGQNNVLYKAVGENYLLCLNTDEQWVNMEESATAIEKVLAEKGFRVQKVLKDGKILIQKDSKTFDLQGKQIK